MHGAVVQEVRYPMNSDLGLCFCLMQFDAHGLPHRRGRPAPLQLRPAPGVPPLVAGGMTGVFGVEDGPGPGRQGAV